MRPGRDIERKSEIDCKQVDLEIDAVPLHLAPFHLIGHLLHFLVVESEQSDRHLESHLMTSSCPTL